MNKWIAEFELEDGDIMPEHMDLEYKGARIDFHCRPLEQEPTTKNDLALIHTEGLDEEIRCTMCTNYMKSDRGCDGSCVVNKDMYKAVMDAIEKRIQPTTKNDLGVREFEGIEVTYPPEDICTYPEYKGKPYFGIKYKENGEEIVGYGTYNPEVLSRYLKDYFISTTKNDLGVDCILRQAVLEQAYAYGNGLEPDGYCVNVEDIQALPSVTPQESKTGQYEKHTDHTDCIWYGSDSGCPVTCSQYRDGWNDAMDYIFKNGKGYQPYRHDG